MRVRTTPGRSHPRLPAVRPSRFPRKLMSLDPEFARRKLETRMKELHDKLG